MKIFDKLFCSGESTKDPEPESTTDLAPPAEPVDLQAHSRRMSALNGYHCEYDAVALMREFEQLDALATPGVIINFLGVRIDPSVMPSVLASMAGTKEPLPLPANWHADIAEWASALKAVKEAKGTFRIIELGCGWGCWLNNTGVAAKSRGLKVELIGVEGDPYHLQSAERTLTLNGFQPSEYRLVHGVAAPKEGRALFPRNNVDGENWGAEPVFYPDAQTRASLLEQGQYFELPCYPLEKISNGQMVDLLHIDIQGAELSFVEENFADIKEVVRRVLIGTHTRYLEGAVIDLFLKHGWIQEMDRPVFMELRAGKPLTIIDGVVAFRNPALP